MNSIIILFALAAVCMDLAREKVDNHFILFGLLLGFLYQVCTCGLRGFVIFVVGIGIPVLFLYILFFFRMLGSGDIKLFSVLGGFIGPYSIAKCIFVSFICGAVISVIVMLLCGNFISRLKYFTNYMNKLLVTENLWSSEEVIPYYRPGKRMENIHFTVPILMSMVIYAGGLLS